MRGTHRGDFMGMPASGKKVTATVADFFRISEGKVVEHWGVSDFASVMQQAGAVS
jgi:predicted ester cyclase